MTEVKIGSQCQHEGCDWEGIECFLPDNPIFDLSTEEIEAGKADEMEPDYYYCSRHAHKEGFCYGCGQFWGGIESFDFGRGARRGLCENCISSGEFDDEEDEDVNMERVYGTYPFDGEEDWQ